MKTRQPVSKESGLSHCDICDIPLSPAACCHRQDHGCDASTSLWCPCCGDFFEGCSPEQMSNAQALEDLFSEDGVEDYSEALRRWRQRPVVSGDNHD